MKPSLLDDLELSSPPAFAPEGETELRAYRSLGCSCGHQRFRVSGWPRAVSGPGGYFWRTVARVWREARMPMQDGEPVESPFFLPVFVRCDRCGRENVLLDGESVVARRGEEGREDPRESYRCRVCRRGLVELVLGSWADAHSKERANYVLAARCCRCDRRARIAWSEGLPSEQEVRLDVLYGRR